MTRVRLALLAAAMALSVAPVAAQSNAPTVNPTAMLTSRPERVIVRGTITCPQGQTFLLHARVTQSGGEGSANGRFETRCAGSPQSWAVPAERTAGRFTPGPARLCVTVRYDGQWWSPNAGWPEHRPETCADVRIVSPTGN